MKINVKGNLWFLSLALLLIFSSCEDDKKGAFEIYTGTLTVMQKDAYSKIPGKNNAFWPPHTTTVFKWDNGEEVQQNHGTAPEEKDSTGTPIMDVIKVYKFTGSKEQLEALEEAYVDAVCDSVDGKPYNTFLSLEEGKKELETVILKSLGEFITDDSNNFAHPGFSKEQVLQIISSGDVSKLMPLLTNSGLPIDKLKVALDKIIKSSFAKLGQDITNYHVCNNDANLQVKLIKNYMATGKVEMPERKCTGPLIYFYPN